MYLLVWTDDFGLVLGFGFCLFFSLVFVELAGAGLELLGLELLDLGLESVRRVVSSTARVLA